MVTILRRNCLLIYVIKEKIGGTGRRGRGCKQLLDEANKERYVNLYEEALDRTVCRAASGRGYGPFVRLTA